jgi:membrane-associated HD superfamily phosphohydrolase
LVRFFPSLKHGWGITAPQNKRTMENQEEKETSLEYFYDKVLDASEFYESEYKAIVDALNEAKKMYDEEIEKAYMKGKMDFKNQAIAFYEDKINMAYKEGWFDGAENFNPNKNK